MNQIKTPSKQNGFTYVGVLFMLLVILTGVMVFLAGAKLWGRHARNEKYQQDAQILLESAQNWREDNDQRWPDLCLIDYGVDKLCSSSDQRDTILSGAGDLSKNYELFIVDVDFIEGDISTNKLVSYGLGKPALILVNEAACFQGRELSRSNTTAIIYAQETKDGSTPVCL